jgi:hypothetical protein
VYRPGSTRPDYDVAWFDAYWAKPQAGILQDDERPAVEE